MKKTILAKYLAVALAAGLTSFAGSAKATISIPSDVSSMLSDTSILDTFFTAENYDFNKIFNPNYAVSKYHKSAQADHMQMDENIASFMALYLKNPTNYNGLVNPSAYINNNLGMDVSMELNAIRALGPNYNASDYQNLKLDLRGAQNQINTLQADIHTLNQDLAALGMNSIIQGSSTAAVPEPSQVAASMLLVAGIAGFVIVRRRQESSDLEALAA